MPYILLDRTFNSPDLSLGGRFFNGWWETIKKKYRTSIEINGHSTVELDFAGMHIRMRYHMVKIDYHIDPYDIPALIELAKQQGKPWKRVRKNIKKLTNAILNALEEFEPWLWNVYPLEQMSYGQASDIIRSHHDAVKHDFFKGCGLECMRIESEIIEAVMLRGVEAGILVLPIHDSVRVAAENEIIVRDWMIEEYKMRLGFDIHKL